MSDVKITQAIYEDEKSRLICLIPKDKIKGGISCHEHTLCDHKVLELFDFLESEIQKLKQAYDELMKAIEFSMLEDLFVSNGEYEEMFKYNHVDWFQDILGGAVEKAQEVLK